jgi:hypothetical protein
MFKLKYRTAPMQKQWDFCCYFFVTTVAWLFSPKLPLISFVLSPDVRLFCLNRGLGPWGPDLVRRYTTARFGSHSTGELLTEHESSLLTGKCPLLHYISKSIFLDDDFI